MLVSKDILYSRPGGGTFIKSTVEKDIDDPMLVLFRENPEYRFDVLEIRHALEASAAYYAALRATNDDKEKIKACFDHMMVLHGSEDAIESAKADAAFHLSIVEASHNLVLLHVMRGLFDLLQNSISHNLDKLYLRPHVFEPLTEQHRELMEAILTRKPDVAREIAQQHLVFVEKCIKEIDTEEARRRRSSVNLPY